MPLFAVKTDWKKQLNKSALSLLLDTKRWLSLRKLGARFCFVIDLTKDQKCLMLLRRGSFSLME